MIEKVLFRVEVSGSIYVWAEDEEDAREEAEYVLFNPQYDVEDVDIIIGRPVKLRPCDLEVWCAADTVPFGEPPEGFAGLGLARALDRLVELRMDRPGPHPDQLPLPGICGESNDGKEDKDRKR